MNNISNHEKLKLFTQFRDELGLAPDSKRHKNNNFNPNINNISYNNSSVAPDLVKFLYLLCTFITKIKKKKKKKKKKFTRNNKIQHVMLLNTFNMMS